MTKPSNKTAKSKTAAENVDNSNGAPPPFPFFTPEAAGANAVQNGALAMQHMVAAGQELTRFYVDRVRKDFDTMRAFATCRTPTDLAVVASEAASEMVHDYANEFDTVLAINLNGIAAGERDTA